MCGGIKVLRGPYTAHDSPTVSFDSFTQLIVLPQVIELLSLTTIYLYTRIFKLMRKLYFPLLVSPCGLGKYKRSAP